MKLGQYTISLKLSVLVEDDTPDPVAQGNHPTGNAQTARNAAASTSSVPETPQNTAPSAPQRTAPAAEPPQRPGLNREGKPLITPAQLGKIKQLCREKGLPLPTELEDYSKQEASDTIKELLG